MSGISTSIAVQDRVSGALNRITASLYNTTSAFYDVDSASEATFNASGVQAMAQELYAYENRIQQLEADLVSANNRLEQMEEQTQRTAQSANLLENAYRGVISVLSAIGVQQILNMSDSLVQTTSRLNMMNDRLQTTQELLQMTYESAQDARGDFSGMADVVARFGNNAKDAFDSSAEVVAFSELVQKQMTIAGASTEEASNAMVQLAQALGSGVLRGDELNSIFEQAPNLIQNIADYLDKPIGEIREMASEGLLTADIVKNAIFAASDEINANFEEMPITWGQIWQSMQNTALIKFQPVLQRLNDIANSERFNQFIDGATTAMAVVANTTLTIFDTVGAVGAFIYDNWSIIGPVIYGVVAALALYALYLGVVNGIELISNGIKIASCIASYAHAVATGTQASATAAATAAQYGFNTALLACPITWIIIAIIALIAIIVAVCNWIAKTTDVANTGFGVITGGLAVAVAFIKNVVIGLINYVISAGINLYNMISNFTGGLELMFSNPLDGIKVMFLSVFNFIVGIVQSAAALLDTVFGSSLADAVSGFQDKIQAEINTTLEANGIESKTLDASDYLLERVEYGDAFAAGAAWGDKKWDNLVASLDTSAIDSAYTEAGAGSVADSLASIASDTSAIKDSVDISDENLKYLRDVAERDVVNRFTTAEIKVDMQNNNNISSGMDIDGIVEQLTTGVQEAMEQAAEGVHE